MDRINDLIRRMLEDLRLRNHSKNTSKAYSWHVKNFANHFNKSPEELGFDEVRSYLVHRREVQRIGISQYKQAVAGLRFCYKYTLGKEWLKERIRYPKVIKRLPRVVSKEEVSAFLKAVDHEKCKVALRLIYATGLRLMEALTLQVPDIDSKQMCIVVRAAKGMKERRALLSETILEERGISLDRTHWIHSSKNKRYFVSQKILASMFQGIFIEGLRKLYQQKKISFDGDFERLIVEALAKDWVIHCKPPFSGPVDVIKYLARYTGKVAISNSRLVALENDTVSFTFNDYSDCCKKKTARLSVVEFIRRFMLHIPTPKFIRIRHFGFLGNSNKKENLELCRTLLAHKERDQENLSRTCHDTFCLGKCPHCMIGTLVIISELASSSALVWNTS